MLTPDQWKKMQDFLRRDPHAYVGHATDCRLFVEGVLWISRSGAQWRLLAAEYGAWNSIYKRFARWCEAGVWERMLTTFASEPDMESVMLDSTFVRAHPCAAGAQKSGDQATQALGRSRGGFSTKIHGVVDALGNPLRLRLTAGQVHDVTQAVELLAGLSAGHVIADRGYAAQALVDHIQHTGATVVISPHQRSKQPRDYDRWLYRERHLVECFMNKIKQFRRVFSRFDKLAQRYAGFLRLVCSILWLR